MSSIVVPPRGVGFCHRISALVSTVLRQPLRFTICHAAGCKRR